MLFKSTDELRKYLPVNVSSSIENVLPYVKRAERKFIIPWLSQAEYDKLNTDYNSGTNAAKYKALIEYAQEPLANYAYLLSVPLQQLQVSDAGIRIVVTDGFKTAFPWQIDALNLSLMDAGYEAIDAMLTFLEANKGTYTDWAASDAYSIFKESFVNTASEFSKYFNIGNSRRTFMQLKPIIARMEDFKIKGTIGPELFDEIKAAIKATPTTPLASKYKILLAFIQPAVIHFTIAMAISELTIRITENGLQVYVGSQTNVTNPATPAPDNHLSNIQNSAEKNGNDYLKQLKDYLYAHVDDYLTFKNSSSYVDPTTIEAETISNTNHPSIYSA